MTAAPAPDVSVLIAAWRAADFIAPAIRSALEQTGVTLEVIVVDDASPDETLAAARAAGQGDRRLRLERLAINGGPSLARNHGLSLATGRYLAVLDADDSFEPGRLAELVRHADKTGADLIADNMNRVAEPGSAGAPFLNPAALMAPQEITLADYLDPAAEVRFGENLGYLKPLFRRETLLRSGFRYDPSLRNSEDFYLVAHLLASGARMVLHPLRGYNYLVRIGSISHRLSPQLTQAILDAEADFARRHGDRFDAVTRKAQEARHARLRDIHAFECLVAALKQRRAMAVMSTLTTHPASIGHIARRLGAIAAARLRP